jgi:hypothetical protein
VLSPLLWDLIAAKPTNIFFFFEVRSATSTP